ncbi:MAG: heavy metal translocating P-type ATPase [Pseudobdellovibrionaceae bacterium]
MSASPTAENIHYPDLVREDATDHTKHLSLMVGGVHCAGCIQKIESALQRDPAIREARLNFTTKRLSLVWDGAGEKVSSFAATVQGLGYSVSPFMEALEKNTEDATYKFYLMCLGVAGFAAGNLMLISVGLWITDAQTMGPITRDFLHWISALIAIPAVIFAGRPFFRSAWQALTHKQANMDVPISVGIILTTGMSLLETIRHGQHIYFDSAVMLTFFLLIGRTLDHRARKTARAAASDLLKTFTGFASVITDEGTKTVPIRDLREDMNIRVTAGQAFPVDGVVLDGLSQVDMSLVTGETVPVNVEKGADVYAGTLNLDAPLTIRVAKAAEDSLLADIVRLMEKAAQGQAKYVRLADRIARAYTPVVHTLAALAFLLWFFILGADWHQALTIAIAVLIITCPCALGLAVPVVQVLASGRLMKDDVLLKSGDALERLATIDTVFFDKTGTLTLGEPTLQNMDALMQEDLALAAALGTQSRHPYAQAIAKAWGTNSLPQVTDIKEIAGKGMEGLYEGEPLYLGRRDDDAETGETPHIWFIRGQNTPLRLDLSDEVRKGAKATVQAFLDKGFAVHLVTGDREGPARQVGAFCGFPDDHIHSGLKPDEKYALLMKMKGQEARILMVGDGLNDAPTLAGADIAMAPGTAIDMAQNAADMVFMGKDLRIVSQTHDIALTSGTLVRQNIGFALAYNVVAIPLAFCGFVTPMIAALAMSASSIVVITNAFRLKRIKPIV